MMPRIHKRSGVWTCGKCGWVIDDQKTPHRATCPICPTIRRPTYVMVGDLVEKALSAVGITKPLVEKLTRTEGKTGGCGCAGRQKWMNEAGIVVQEKARAALLAAKGFYLGQH